MYNPNTHTLPTIKTKIHFLSATLLAIFFILPMNGQVRLPRLKSDGIVLQRDAELKIWGWASPGESITLEFMGARYSTTAEASGEWLVKLPPVPAGGPYTITIEATNKLTINDIPIGDVWLCSGLITGDSGPGVKSRPGRLGLRWGQIAGCWRN